MLDKIILGCILTLLLLQGCGGQASDQQEQEQEQEPPLESTLWDKIKSNAQPLVVKSDEFGTPYLQSHSTLAWEDGVFMSRDGLHMYAFYSPADILKFVQYISVNPVCPDITPFLRGPQLGMDLTTNPWGCDSILHSDIAYASRKNTSEPFSAWQLSGVANAYRWDGGFQATEDGNGKIDAVMSVSTTNDNLNDIYWAKGVDHNPSFDSFTAMPSPINDAQQQDNPHLERFDATTLVLLFDNHGVGDAVTSMKYSISTDNGTNWSTPMALGANINAGAHDFQGHLYKDGSDWWLYFTSERTSQSSIFRSKHNDSANITTDFDNWGTAEQVVAPGVIADNSGFVAGLGEPSLTSTGDLSFVVVYGMHEDNEYDRFDIDPWFLPRIQ